MATQMIFFNGKFVPENEAHISVKTHALQYGTGVFEGIRAYYNELKKAHVVFRMDDHYRRMEQSCKILYTKLPHTVKQLHDITVELLQKNFTPEDIYIRPFMYKSTPIVNSFNLQSLDTGFTIYTVPMGRYLPANKGIHAHISSWHRIDDNAIPPRAKISGSYVNTALAKTESDLLGFDEALLLDSNGHVVEGSAENLFIVKDNLVITPSVSDNILVGVTRDTILKLCKDLKIPVTERSIARTEIYTADEIFLVGTGAEISAVVSVDHRSIGSGSIGTVTNSLKELYFKLVHGELGGYDQFLDIIPVS